MTNKKNTNNNCSCNNQLSGKDNNRLTNTNPTNCECTAAWSNEDKFQDRTKVSIPSDYSVNKAKNWVDNGSQT